ncbi:MAG: aminodeoxychorismate lyase [Halioglobus sp.]
MTSQTATWVDGAPASVLALPDRALDFGDGLFETLLLRHGTPLYLDLHMQRLQRGLQALALPDCLANVRLQLAQVANSVQESEWMWSALRVTVSRGSGPRGYAPPLTPRPRIIITVTQLGRDCAQLSEGAVLALAEMRWAAQPALAGIKHLNRLEQVLAAAQARAAGADEAVMLGQSGQLISVVAGNLFLVRGGQLLTPAIQDSGIAGTRRQLVMERWAKLLGLGVQETNLSLDDLATADEVFYSNSLLGLRPVASFGDHQWRDHSVCQSLFEQYRGELP